MKKEDLIKRVGVLEADIKNRQERSEKNREELSMLLGWSKGDIYSRAYDEYNGYSWVKIAGEIGKLLKLKERESLENQVNSLQLENSTLKELLKKYDSTEK